MRVVFDNRHMDNSGGGEHVRMLMALFSRYADVYVTKAPEFYLKNNYANTEITGKLKRYRYTFKPDLFIYTDYRGYTKPIGIVNAQICFYGLSKNVSGYDFGLCLNEFVSKSIRENWEIEPVVIEPFFDLSAFRCGPKEKTLINIGNFFCEQDGHSKNQHLLIKWFLESGLAEEGWTFDFFGFMNDPDYFEELKELTVGVHSIRLHPNAERSLVLDTLSRARFMIHGMGYGRNLAEQTEHFGLVAVQALLSGCRPIVHRSGGCWQIPGALSYREFDEISNLMAAEIQSPEQIRGYGCHFSFENALSQTRNFLKKISERQTGAESGSARRFDDFCFWFENIVERLQR